MGDDIADCRQGHHPISLASSAKGSVRVQCDSSLFRPPWVALRRTGGFLLLKPEMPASQMSLLHSLWLRRQRPWMQHAAPGVLVHGLQKLLSDVIKETMSYRWMI